MIGQYMTVTICLSSLGIDKVTITASSISNL